ncbi:RNA-directed DNA polymerase from mobile element jockey [Willisornis vidua]|uniref:RNA-directed DNA polymerase from mobile element jockey n=1 Tax=Willisornis vidua TaxID=1566151 RepID=A0ABQ9D023_9PASS|nr:RNA-directed DNA polymerase from mobile element jockey [Willisornis vidua]
MLSLRLSSTQIMNQGGLSALRWKTDCENDQFSIDPEILWDLLLQLDPHKSTGPDGIHSRILEQLADVIAKPLSMIFKQSWESVEVPADWKPGNDVPIFKKGKKDGPENDRPVNLTLLPFNLRRFFWEVLKNA